VEKLLKELVDIGKAMIYMAENKPYIFIKNLANHQVIDRPRKSSLPLPTENQLKSTEIMLGRKEGKEGKRQLISIDFLSYFNQKTRKSFKPTKDKIDLVEKRLAEGYTIEQLKKAVDNFVQDTWEGRRDHMDLIYCIGKQKGKPDNLEKWLNAKAQERKMNPL